MKILVIICFICIAHSLPLNQCHMSSRNLSLQFYFVGWCEHENNLIKFCHVVFKNWKRFQCYQKSKKKAYTPLSYVHHSLKEKKANKKIAQSAQSVHCAQSAVCFIMATHFQVQSVYNTYILNHAQIISRHSSFHRNKWKVSLARVTQVRVVSVFITVKKVPWRVWSRGKLIFRQRGWLP